MKENRLVLIDADSLTFYSSKETIEESIENLKYRIENILEQTEATSFIMFLTGRKCFRYDIYSEYKANRKKRYGTPLKYLKTLKSFLIEEYRACLIQELEADDTVAYYHNNMVNADTEVFVASPDKDVLGQLIGTHWNYKHMLLDKDTPDERVERGRWVITNEEASNRFLAFQLLCGDRGDNIPGIELRTEYMKKKFGLDNRKGVGEVTANKILDIIEKDLGGNYAAEVFKCYQSKYKEDDVDKALEDYTLQRHLLQLSTQISNFNKILQHYDIQQHVNEVIGVEEVDETDDDF